MSNADWVYLKTTNRILKDGAWDTKETVRPKWADGTPAHTAKIFAVNNVYDLSKEFPIVTLRFTNWKAAIDEILWIWQLKSNNVNDLNSHIWDQWADENGSIGKAYGWQVKQKAIYKDGEFDQIDRVIWYLKNQPAFRSMVTELFVHKDLHEMGLYPCVHGMQFDVTDGKLNLFLNQRSNDTLAAGSWNVVQYSVLVYMLAQVCNLKPGVLSHMIVNSHIYDRHIPFIVDITMSRAKLIKERVAKVSENDKKVLSDEELKTFNEFASMLQQDCSDFDEIINQAQTMEKQIAKYDLPSDDPDKISFKDSPIDFENYTKNIVETNEFKCAYKIVEIMANNPSFEKILNFSSPKLILDGKVNDFYQFISPKAKDSSGKIIDNPKSSFKVEDYNYQQDGVKLQAKVPVAE